MHRLRTGASGGIENALDNEVGFVDGCRADADSLVGETHMPRIGVGLGIHGNRADTHASCRSDDTAGDFAAIGDENFCKHSEPFTTKAPRTPRSTKKTWQSSLSLLGEALCAWCLGGSLFHQPTIQFGVRFSRKAAKPSLPSGLARTREIRCTVSSMVS